MKNDDNDLSGDPDVDYFKRGIVVAIFLAILCAGMLYGLELLRLHIVGG